MFRKAQNIQSLLFSTIKKSPEFFFAVFKLPVSHAVHMKVYQHDDAPLYYSNALNVL